MLSDPPLIFLRPFGEISFWRMKSETTKSMLFASTYLHLKRNEFVKYASDLPTLCPIILLSSPAGSEIYQETLAKALAKHVDARLLVVDSLLLPGGSDGKESGGGICEEDHDFFCSAESLRLDYASADDIDKLVIYELFEVAVKESKRGSLLLFVKDIEKSMLGYPGEYASFKSKLENAPGNVIVIASHTQIDSRKEKGIRPQRVMYKVSVSFYLEILTGRRPKE